MSIQINRTDYPHHVPPTSNWVVEREQLIIFLIIVVFLVEILDFLITG